VINAALEGLITGLSEKRAQLEADAGEEGGKQPETGRNPLNRGWRAEAYDISNTNGVDSVGALVVFEGSSPVRKDYRRFKIRTVEGPNDVGSLQEVLTRRFKRGLAGDRSFDTMPDCSS
jgi:excinuclease UvrABC nuclease subunit